MSEESSTTFRYRVFLSYSHGDRRWARWLHRALETYRIPKHVLIHNADNNQRPRRLAPVFRDRDDLSTSASLSGAVNEALLASESMVVICSPAAAKSRWVNEEILAFKRLRNSSQIFCFIVEGEPNSGDDTECFPPAVRFELAASGELSSVPAEPLAADSRLTGDGRTVAKIKLIAGLLGVGFDDLRRRDLQRRHHRMLAVTSGSLLIAMLTITLAVMASLANAKAERRRAQAEDLIGFMLGDLQEGLHEIGRLDVFMRVGNKAMEYFASLRDEDVNDETLSQRSKALRQIGNARLNQGETALALDSFRESLDIAQKLALRNPDNAEWQIALANSHFYVGYVYWQRDELDSAQSEFQTVLPIVDAVSIQDPLNAEWLAERAYAYTNLGRVLELQGQLEHALQIYQEVQVINDRTLALEPANVDYQLEVGFSHNNLGKLVESMGRLQEAEGHFRQDLKIKQAVSSAQPSHNLWRGYLSTSHLFLARNLASTGNLAEAHKHYEEALEIAVMLLLVDPDNPDSLARKASCERELGSLERRLGNLEAANQKILAAKATFDHLLTIDRSMAQWQRESALATLEAAQLASLAMEHIRAMDLSLSAKATINNLLEHEPGSLENQKIWAVALAVEGSVLEQSGDPESAQLSRVQALESLNLNFPGTQSPELLDVRATLLVKLGNNNGAEQLREQLQAIGYHSKFE